MSPANIVDLAECSEFRQTLAARPPRIVHGAAMLLIVLLAAAVIWAALVKANLVVKAFGRVRPEEVPTRVFTSTSADLEGRVVESPFEEGDVVRQGDVLVRLDTAHIDNRMAKIERTLESSTEELAKLAALETLLTDQLAAAREKAQAELSQAEAVLAVAISRRESEIRRTQVEVTLARDACERSRPLVAARTVSQQEYLRLESDLRQAMERLVQAELPVEEAPVGVARRALELVECDFAVRQAELEARKVTKQGEIDAARNDLANLTLQRKDAELRSPVDGVVVAGRVQVGDVLERGKPALEIAQQRSYIFEALIPSGDVGNLRVGMPVNIKFDAYDYQKYGVLTGKVTYLSPDSKVAEAGEGHNGTAQGPANASPAAFVVRVALDADEVGRGDCRGRVTLGMGGTAEIVTDRESVLMILFKKIRQTVSLG